MAGDDCWFLDGPGSVVNWANELNLFVSSRLEENLVEEEAGDDVRDDDEWVLMEDWADEMAVWKTSTTGVNFDGNRDEASFSVWKGLEITWVPEKNLFSEWVLSSFCEEAFWSLKNVSGE